MRNFLKKIWDACGGIIFILIFFAICISWALIFGLRLSK